LYLLRLISWRVTTNCASHAPFEQLPYPNFIKYYSMSERAQKSVVCVDPVAFPRQFGDSL
jgi:hypothetical protein